MFNIIDHLHFYSCEWLCRQGPSILLCPGAYNAVPSQESEWACICELEVSIFSLFLRFSDWIVVLFQQFSKKKSILIPATVLCKTYFPFKYLCFRSKITCCQCANDIVNVHVTLVQFLYLFIYLCWRHTVPKLTPDGHTIMEMFKFGSDRKTIGPFVRAS